MFLISLFIVNVIIVFFIWIYMKLTCGYCKSSRHLIGKVVIVTGANNGIGYETAKDLADRGARVILACRNDALGEEAKEKIVKETGNKDVHYHNLDLVSLKSVRKFADKILKTEKRLDILINNAGIYKSEFAKTEDGLLVGMQVNHFAPFLLTCLLLPLIKSSAPSKIINVSSITYSRGKIDFQNLNMEKESKETFSNSQIYSNTKLCNVLMTTELAKQLKGTGVTVNCLHPGVVMTNIFTPLKYQALLKLFVFPILRHFVKTSWEGAQTTIYLAVSPEVDEVSGRYFMDCRERQISSIANDEHIARKLWEVSEKLVKIKS